MISERLRDTYVMWSDPNSPYCDGTPHCAGVVLEAADVIDALVAALGAARDHIRGVTGSDYRPGSDSAAVVADCNAALAAARK